MKKIKIIQEAFEKAKEVYWEENKTVCISIELWKYSDGHEKVSVKLWLDEDVANINAKSSHIVDSKSFQQLLDFLGIEDHPEFTFSDGKVYYEGHLVGFPEGDPRFTTFGGAPPGDDL